MLLAWAEKQVRIEAAETGTRAEAPGARADPGLLRALVVAWSVRPDLDRRALAGWLQERLYVSIDDAEQATALEALRAEGALDAHGRPQTGRLSELVDQWGLRAWVREARRADGDQG